MSPAGERSPLGVSDLSQQDLTDQALVETLRRRTKRVAMAPWLWHLGLVEFCRFAYKASGRDARRVFDWLRIRDAALLGGAYALVPSEVLGLVGLATDAVAVNRLTRSIEPAHLAKDRSLGAFPMAAAWALSFNSPRARGPLAALLPGAMHMLFARAHKVPRQIAASATVREAVWGAAFLYVVAELSTSIRTAIKQELLAIQGARRSTEIAADRRSKARLWLVGTHTRLNALAAARWAVEAVRDQPGPAEFIKVTRMEETRLREMFERRTVSLERFVIRICAVRSIRGLDTATNTTDLGGEELHEDNESVVEWVVEALCAFASGDLTVDVHVEEGHAIVVLEADWFPRELMQPFQVGQARNGRRRVEGRLPLACMTRQS